MDVDILYSARARFAVCDGEDVVVALVHQARMARAARQRGERMDHVLETGATAEGGAAFAFQGPDLVLLGGEARRFRLAGGKFEAIPP